MNAAFALRRRRFDLRPVGIGVAPESAPPGLIKRIERDVTGFQPVAETGLAVMAMALAAVFVGNMPANHRRMMGVTLRQRTVHQLHFFGIHRRTHTVIVTPAVQCFYAVTPDAQDFRILLRHPRRTCAAWCGKKYRDAIFMQLVQHLIQPAKGKMTFFRLQR
ncbi:hypothetical protein SRABI106_04492 [Rahnella aquatilis]|nr:hypothetical protein SRABI106_04492 [Rahnella aquatilis]